VSASAANGLLLLAHGARNPAWAQPFEAVAAQCRAATDGPVALAYLALMAPNAACAAATLAAQGCARVDIVPLFLGAGGHVRRDLPALQARLTATHPGVRWRLHPAAGEAAAVISALAAVALAAGAAADGAEHPQEIAR
jgi:sirohydrochlorin cobaltochelatase